MNAADHLTQAERLLAEADSHIAPGETDVATSLALQAAGHALIALADIAGAPHAPGQPGGPASG